MNTRNPRILDGWMKKAELTVYEKLEAVGRSNVTVRIEWASRFIAKIGEARIISHARREGRIRLSMPLWPMAPESERTETVVHELAHILDFLDRGPIKPVVARNSRGRLTRKREEQHGASWEKWMRKLGYPNPSRCHRVGAEQTAARIMEKRAANPAKRVTCPLCLQQVVVGPRQFKAMLRGTAYIHKKCGGRLGPLEASKGG